MAKTFGYRFPPKVESYLFVELTIHDAMALYSRWMNQLDKSLEWKSFYAQLEKTHRISKRIESDEGTITTYTQMYSVIIIAAKKQLTKKELIEHIKDLKDTPSNYESSMGKNR